VEEDVSRDKTGGEMSQAAFECLFENFSPSKMEAKKLAREISEDEKGNSQDRNHFLEQKNGQEASKEEKSDGWEFSVFFGFIEASYGFEEEDVDFFEKETDKIEEKKEESNNPDEDKGVSFVCFHVIDDEYDG